jgi:assimilatory nitrate reductase catalytic subunit
VADGEPVRVTTRRGSLVLAAKVVRTIRADTVFIPYHWAKPIAANQLTIARFDPKSWIPAFKACAVRLEPSDEPVPPVPAPPVVDDEGDVPA